MISRFIARTIISVGRLLFVVLTLGAGHVQAAQLWGTSLAGGFSFEAISIDIATGAPGPQVIVATPQRLSGDDLASDPSRQPNIVWTVRWNVDGSRLIGFDPFVAEVTSNALLNAPTRMLGIAINPIDGVMYGNTDTNLYVINRASGVTSLVGPMVPSRTIGFDATGRLLASTFTNALVSVDTNTAASTTIANIDRNLDDIAADPDTGLLYGISGDGLYQINPTTGGLTKLGATFIRPAGFAFTDVPEPMLVPLVVAVVASLSGRAPAAPFRCAPSRD